MVLLINGWLDTDWMKNPISVKTLSNICPIVKKNKVCPVKYKVRPVKYKDCQVTVKTLSKTFELGQRLDMEIQSLS